MIEAKTEDRLLNIESKLDLIYEEIEAAKRHRKEMQELKNDLAVIAKDIFSTTVAELEDIAPFVQTGDFLHLLKKLLRNTNTITNTISKFESAIDFIEDARPLSKELFNDTLRKFDELDRKGYFKLGKEIGKAVDPMVECMTTKDVSNVANSVVNAICLFKSIAGTDLIKSLEKSIHRVQDIDKSQYEGITMMRFFKELNSPEIRQLLGIAILFLKALADETKIKKIEKE